MITGVDLTETCRSCVSGWPASQIRALNTVLSDTFKAC